MDEKLRTNLKPIICRECSLLGKVACVDDCPKIDLVASMIEQAFRDAHWIEPQQPVEGELVGTTGTSYPTICDKCERGTYYWIAHGDEKWCLECHHKDYQEQNQQTIVTIPESNFGKHGGTCCLGCHEAQLAYDKVRMKVHPSEGELAPCPFLIGGTRICEKPKFGRHETCITSNCAVIEGIKAQLAHDKARLYLWGLGACSEHIRDIDDGVFTKLECPECWKMLAKGWHPPSECPQKPTLSGVEKQHILQALTGHYEQMENECAVCDEIKRKLG